MGKFVFQNAYLAIDSSTGGQVVLSDHVRSLTLNFSRAEVDSTCMTDDGMARIAGLRDWSMDVEFAQDYSTAATAKVDNCIWNAMNSTLASLTVTFRPTTAAVGVTNPQYSGEGWYFDYTPASGSPGDLATASVSIRAVTGSSAGSTTWLKRATA